LDGTFIKAERGVLYLLGLMSGFVDSPLGVSVLYSGTDVGRAFVIIVIDSTASAQNFMGKFASITAARAFL
jgi:hypothetical protein